MGVTGSSYRTQYRSVISDRGLRRINFFLAPRPSHAHLIYIWCARLAPCFTSLQAHSARSRPHDRATVGCANLNKKSRKCPCLCHALYKSLFEREISENNANTQIAHKLKKKKSLKILKLFFSFFVKLKEIKNNVITTLMKSKKRKI